MQDPQTKILLNRLASTVEVPGASGITVRALQERLNLKMKANLSIDGNYDAGTAYAVALYQAFHNLDVSGVADSATLHSLAGRRPSQPPQIDRLPHSTQSGYKNGAKFQFPAIELGSFKIEAQAGRAFLEMAYAAHQDGVHLRINSAFRTMQEQTALWNEYQANKARKAELQRTDPVQAKKIKVVLAAKPGFSDHQSARALDLESGGGQNQAAKWLSSHSEEHGFRRSVPSEPWHYEFEEVE